MCCITSFGALGQSFTVSQLSGETSINPTQISFGPDQRLYVLEKDGALKIYTVNRTAPNSYQVTATETVSLVKQIQNHNDNGVVHATVRRQAIGMVVTGTASSPVVYVSSSDYRVGGGFPFGTDTNLDTNSGTISRLTKSGGTWSRVDLVRGLPRSEENHSTNSLFLDEENGMLYVAQGGNTNGGAPSNAFARMCEFAYSAAVLSIDLDVLDTMPVLTDTSSGASYVYNLPTVDDPTRGNANGIDDPMDMNYNGVDLHDPFGGNDGLNQARLTETGPVQIHGSGFRNIYDIVITDLGFMYGWDNGPNPVWGGYPLNEGFGTASNNYPTGEPGSTTMNNIDCLHKITAGYYAGHPNPTRGNPDSAGLYTYAATGVYRTEYLAGNPDSSLPYDWPPLPMSMADPIQGDFQIAGVENTYMDSIFKKSMNGICEYTASNFDELMQGDLLTTAFVNGFLYRINLDTAGNLVSPDTGITVLASNLSGMPLDVCTLGDEPPYPGSIWIVGHISGGPIHVLEPQDFFVCTGADSYSIDEDSDGYTNGDEYDNGTNPCNAADRPADFDMTLIGGFLVSNLNDPDDDDDGIPDSTDRFAWDATNGLTTFLPLEYPMLNADPGTGFYGLGFTGFMTNGTDDYLELWRNESNSSTSIVAGGAAGLLTIAPVDTGDALGALNNQHNGFQFGVAIDSLDEALIYEGVLQGPMFPDSAYDFQSAGIFVGTGTQHDYVKIIVNANGGNPGIRVVVEDNDTALSNQYAVPGIDMADNIHLALIVNPANGFIRSQYAINSGELMDLDTGFYVSGALLTNLKGPDALAVGVISTGRGTDSAFIATWDHLRLYHSPLTAGRWYTLQNASSCAPLGQPGSCCQGRHEAAFVQSGDKFYLLGGREHSSNVNIYNPATDVWTTGANPPGNSLHHFQGFDYHGLIVAAGAMKGIFIESEASVANMKVYDPLTNTWFEGPDIPQSRRRGSAGAVVAGDSLYLVGGITNGHLNGSVEWADRYDFRTNSWTQLPNAPHKRDHFHLAEKDGKLLAAAGRRTVISNLWLDTEPDVDVLDLNTMNWQTLSESIPTQRAGNTVTLIGDELIVIGGEREAGPAKRATEALNIETETWRVLDSLNTPRHGTQAILNNGGIYVASGATMRGGSSTTRRVESFHFYGQEDPVLSPTIASTLAADDVAFGQVPVQEEALFDLYVFNTTGNQAILLRSMTMFDSTAVTVDTALTFPRFLKPGDSLRIPLRFYPTAMQLYSDTLYFLQTGTGGAQKKIVIDGEGIFNWLGDTRAYVDSSATGTGLGTSWDDAFTTVQAALNAAAGFPEITDVWIAEGTYKPAEMRSASFTLRDSLTLYGGFHGTEILLGQRDIEAFPVVFSGDIGASGDSTDNVYHVVVMTGTSDTAALDGITVAYGQADGSSAMDKEGAGVLNFGKLALRNCTIRNCIAINPGSAVVNDGVSGMLILEMVEMHSNSDPHLLNKNGGTLRWIGVSALED